MTAVMKPHVFEPDAETIARLAEEIHRENIDVDPGEPGAAPRMERRGGAKVLLLAIVRQAVCTLEDWSRRFDTFDRGPRRFQQFRRDARTAYRYLISNSTEPVTSFLSVCELTGADPDAVREHALKNLSATARKALFVNSAKTGAIP